MSNPCTASTCLNGNCPGCKNGVLYCDDPRCWPNCANCNTSAPSNSNWWIVTIILVLLGILLIMSFIIGYDLFSSRKKAAEPKNITVNKHVHSIKPAPIVINSPPPVVASSLASLGPAQTSQDLQTTQMSQQISNEPLVSYNGMNLSKEGIPQKTQSYTNNMPNSNNCYNNIPKNCGPIRGVE